jgi:CRP/FNR family transcriptional regulator, nitrogen oxide reductase regulator
MLQSPLLTGLSEPDVRDVLSRARVQSFSKGDVLFRQDAPAEALHVVAEGRVKLTQVTAEGQEIIVRLCGPGEVFAGIAVLDGKTYPFTAAAVESARVLRWTRPVLRALFEACPRLEANVLEIVGGHAREMLDRFRELATEPVPRRVARALLRQVPGERQHEDAFLIEGVTQQDLAEMAATTLYTVSRVLSEWEGAGVVETGRGRIHVLSRRRLQELAEVPADTR